jgi:hypothetical protein
MPDETRTPGVDVTSASPDSSRPAGPTEEEIARGRAAGTPFLLLGGVALAIWSVVGLVTLAVLLVWWLG